MELKKIKKFAIENGYDNVEFIGKWKKFEVYDPFFEDEETHAIGLPYKVLIENDEIRMSTPVESMELLKLKK